MKRFITAVIVSVFLVGSVEAFCIYNQTDAQLRVNQVFDRVEPGFTIATGFSANIGAGDYRCCQWNNPTCNPSGKEDSPVYFDVTINSKDVCSKYKIQANQNLYVVGSNSEYRCSLNSNPKSHPNLLNPKVLIQ